MNTYHLYQFCSAKHNILLGSWTLDIGRSLSTIAAWLLARSKVTLRFSLLDTLNSYDSHPINFVRNKIWVFWFRASLLRPGQETIKVPHTYTHADAPSHSWNVRSMRKGRGYTLTKNCSTAALRIFCKLLMLIFRLQELSRCAVRWRWRSL